MTGDVGQMYSSYLSCMSFWVALLAPHQLAVVVRPTIIVLWGMEVEGEGLETQAHPWILS